MSKLKWESYSEFDEYVLITTRNKERALIFPSLSGYEITLLVDPKSKKGWTLKKAKEFVSKLYNMKE